MKFDDPITSCRIPPHATAGPPDGVSTVSDIRAFQGNGHHLPYAPREGVTICHFPILKYIFHANLPRARQHIIAEEGGKPNNSRGAAHTDKHIYTHTHTTFECFICRSQGILLVSTVHQSILVCKRVNYSTCAHCLLRYYEFAVAMLSCLHSKIRSCI
jgi:hypothetical protein